MQYPLDTWRNDWIHLAQQEDGAVWASLLKKWARWLEKQHDSDTWLARHADAARAGRKQAAATRAYDELGVHMHPDGRYKCGLEGCSFVMTLKGMRQHVPVCTTLTIDQRKNRSTAQASTALPAAKSAPKAKARVLPKSFRLLRKQTRPPGLPAPLPRVLSADLEGCRNFDRDIIRTACKEKQLRRPYRGVQLSRLITLTDLPCPDLVTGASKLICRFCQVSFINTGVRYKHMLTCPQMPYDGWIWRVLVTQHEVTTDNFPCKHCGTKFSTPKAAGRRSVGCARRRTRQHLPLNLQKWHDIP